MARPDRLFRLLDTLRRLPQPVTAERLAEEMEVSPRTLYRDIGALRAAGARIEGEAGLGYCLTEDPALPPQMFTRLEVEALMLGLAEVRLAGDPALARAAEAAGAKIIATAFEGKIVEVVNIPGRFGLEKMINVAQRSRLPDGSFHMTWRAEGVEVGIDLKVVSSAQVQANGGEGGSSQRGLAGVVLPRLVAVGKPANAQEGATTPAPVADVRPASLAGGVQ